MKHSLALQTGGQISKSETKQEGVQNRDRTDAPRHSAFSAHLPAGVRVDHEDTEQHQQNKRCVDHLRRRKGPMVTAWAHAIVIALTPSCAMGSEIWNLIGMRLSSGLTITDIPRVVASSSMKSKWDSSNCPPSCVGQRRQPRSVSPIEGVSVLGNTVQHCVSSQPPQQDTGASRAEKLMAVVIKVVLVVVASPAIPTCDGAPDESKSHIPTSQ